MSKVNYFLVNSSILPPVFEKVIKAKNYLASGEAANATQAAKMAGISRSAYYKYKDSIFEYNTFDDQETVTLNAKLRDNAGVLSALMNELYLAGANVLSVSQSVPVNSVADVSVTVRVTQMTVSIHDMVDKIKKVSGVKSVNISDKNMLSGG
ncbi:MAG TPA: ACT domain-containing protein [Candidatus Eubacterium faecigallinarum]|nr:ACT domain-containing protein [Candidatus Eubacterium faecigallinarum]